MKKTFAQIVAAVGLATLFSASVFAQTVPTTAKPGATAVKGYTRKTKSGKVVTVKGYNRAKPGTKSTTVKGYTRKTKSGKIITVKGYNRKAPAKKMTPAMKAH